MRENIVILSQNTHMFLINEIRYAAEIFKRVVVICPEDDQIKKAVSGLCNVESIFFTKKELYKNVVKSLYKILEKEKRSEIIESIKKKKLTISYLKQYLYFLAISRLLHNILSKKLNLSLDESKKWVFYSAWYYGTAYAITEARKKYKYAKTVTLVHSFEVDKRKNEFICFLFRRLYHPRLDKVSFISRNVFNEYKSEIAEKLNLCLENCEVRYLGVKKLFKIMNKRSTDGICRIVSCSNLIPVKRVDLIFQALDNVKGIKIEWIHFGGGKQYDYIKDLINNKKNENLTVKLLGAVENTAIHEFYSKNPVDLFINLSASEGIPVSIMEAIAYGIPVVATSVGGNPEIVKKEFGKLLSANPTLDEIKEAILSIYNLPEDEIKKMRKQAVDFYDKYFNADSIRKDFFRSIKNDVNGEIKC